MNPADDLTLYGFHLSVYTRVVRIVLAEKSLQFDYREINPFDHDLAAAYTVQHPFSRVPALRHGDFTLYETAAITGYLDDTFGGSALMPRTTKAMARVRQVIGIVDAYGYWPLVRQVFAQGVLRPAQGMTYASEEVEDGLAKARPVLAALDAVALEGLVLNTRGFSRADAHLAPMIAAFTAHDQGRDLLAEFPALSIWWGWCRGRASLRLTDCGFDSPACRGA